MKKTSTKVIFALNVAIVTAIMILNYFYQSNGFDFTLKCICSGGFALLGLINLCYSFASETKSKRFQIGMVAGLCLAFLGDVLIGSNFIVGAATFALGHVCFAVAYCFLKKFSLRDLIASGLLFFGALAFLLFCPLLRFEVPAFQVVCIGYALIISVMLGKSIGNFTREQNTLTTTIVVASALFFFSDLMLVLDWFVGLWDWTNEACMGTYYPALCLLSYSVFVKSKKEIEGNEDHDRIV